MHLALIIYRARKSVKYFLHIFQNNLYIKFLCIIYCIISIFYSLFNRFSSFLRLRVPLGRQEKALSERCRPRKGETPSRSTPTETQFGDLQKRGFLIYFHSEPSRFRGAKRKADAVGSDDQRHTKRRKDMLIGESSGRSVDLVVPVDATSSSWLALDAYKQKIKDALRILEPGLPQFYARITNLRVKVIGYRDSLADPEPMLISPFFRIPEETPRSFRFPRCDRAERRWKDPAGKCARGAGSCDAFGLDE